MTKSATEMPAWDYALFAAREFWLSLGGEIGDHTMAATAMLRTGSSMLADALGYADTPHQGGQSVDPALAPPAEDVSLSA